MMEKEKKPRSFWRLVWRQRASEVQRRYQRNAERKMIMIPTISALLLITILFMFTIPWVGIVTGVIAFILWVAYMYGLTKGN